MELFQKKEDLIFFSDHYIWLFGSYISGNAAFNAAFCI